jgi:hypothetical protein
MKIIKKGASHCMEVYGVYQTERTICYLVIPENYEGLLAISSHEADLIDGDIPKDFALTITQDGFTLSVKCLQDIALLERLLECDPEALSEFKQILSTNDQVAVRGKPV